MAVIAGTPSSDTAGLLALLVLQSVFVLPAPTAPCTFAEDTGLATGLAFDALGEACIAETVPEEDGEGILKTSATGAVAP